MTYTYAQRLSTSSYPSRYISFRSHGNLHTIHLITRTSAGLSDPHSRSTYYGHRHPSGHIRYSSILSLQTISPLFDPLYQPTLSISALSRKSSFLTLSISVTPTILLKHIISRTSTFSVHFSYPIYYIGSKSRADVIQSPN